MLSAMHEMFVADWCSEEDVERTILSTLHKTGELDQAYYFITFIISEYTCGPPGVKSLHKTIYKTTLRFG